MSRHKDNEPAQHPIIEVLDRVRRIETRLTHGLQALGVSVVTEKPEWKDGVITIPSLNARLKDILAVVDDSWDDGECVGIRVIHQGELVISFFTD
jgi:hypothetical protein